MVYRMAKEEENHGTSFEHYHKTTLCRGVFFRMKIRGVELIIQVGEFKDLEKLFKIAVSLICRCMVTLTHGYEVEENMTLWKRG
jgi:hypothetical protein